MLNAKSKVILAKTHVSYDTDPAPTAAADAMYTKNFRLKTLEGNRVERDMDGPGWSNNPKINPGAHVSIEFEVELTGATAAATAPGYDPLLTACGCNQTLTPVTGPVEYDPGETSLDAVAIYFNHGTVLHKVLGCRGTWSINISEGGIPMISFRFLGIYSRPSKLAQYAADFSKFVDGVPMNEANTPTATIDGFAAKMQSFTFDANCTVSYRNYVNFEGVLITDRKPTWSAVIEEPDIDTKNFYELAESHANVLNLIPIQIVHGPAGAQADLSLPICQIDDISDGDNEGTKMLTLSGPVIASSAGNDDFKLTVTGT